MKIAPTQNLLLIVIFSLITFSFYAQEADYEEWKMNYDKGVALVEIDSLKKALPYLEKSLEIAENIKIDSIHIKSLNQLSQVYKVSGKYDDAESSIKKSLQLIENTLGKNTEEYSDNLLELSIIYKRKSDYQKVVETAEQSNEIIKSIYSSNSIEYVNNCSNLSKAYVEVDEYDKAISTQKNVLQFFQDKDKTSTDYARACYTMSYLNHFVNEYENEIVYMEKAMRIYGKDYKAYSTFNNNIGLAFQNLGNHEEALSYFLIARKKTKPKNYLLYAIILQNLAFSYTSLGEFEKAKFLYNDALNIWDKHLDKKHKDYGKLLNNIGKLYRETGEFDKAKRLFKSSLDNFSQFFDKNHTKYGYRLNDYASLLLEMGQTEEAIALMEENLQIAIDNSSTDTEDFYGRQYNLAKAYNRTEQFERALPLLKSATENIPNILGVNHPKYGQMLKSLSDTYIGLDETEKAVTLMKSTNEILVNEIDQIFRFRSEKEKQSFIKMLTKNFDDLQSLPLNNHLDLAELNNINLNNQLMLKGLLLNNSKNILSQLSALNDFEIETKIVDFKNNKRLLTKVLTQPVADREIDLDSLKESINTKEALLVKIYSDNFENNMSLIRDWKSSQTNLKNNEIAIEYSSFRLTNKGKKTDSIMYLAYLYKKDWQHPKMVSLFEEKQLKKILNTNRSPNALYSSDKLYNLVWQPLEKHIGKSKTIYYSPSGLLNQIAFSGIKKDKTLSNTYDLVQLSSTAILANKQTEPSLTNTFFIGAIDYDYTKTTTNLPKEASTYAYLDSESLTKLRGTKTRGETWDELPGAIQEINKLQNILKSNNYKYTTLTKEEATESNFKKLSGNSPNVLHIATHGFFYENLKMDSQFNMDLSTEDQYRLADDPLLRSGLILAGANIAWKNGVNPNEEEDGILNAMEISNLDLSNTDIVVLSACETGLGDIDGSEGVYGLQRAFKMAGVDILIMSLWKVPDLETAEFMNLFYTHWMTMKSVRKAFNKAQRKMQHKYKNEPLNWAAFVLFE